MNYRYDVVIIGAGPGGIYAAYNMAIKNTKEPKSILVIEKGKELNKRECHMKKIGHCIKCPTCSIMQGFGGAGAFSDGKFNITNDFGGTLWNKIGKEEAVSYMKKVDAINEELWGNKEFPELHSSSTEHGKSIKKKCIENGLRLLDADIRHLGTDGNLKILKALYNKLSENGVEFMFDTNVTNIEKGYDNSYWVVNTSNDTITATDVIVSVGRSGSHWLEDVSKKLDIKTHSNKVDIGVRVELPHIVFSEMTDKLYESKIVNKTKEYQDNVRTFCMNPYGYVVNENTNGIITVNGHSLEDVSKRTDNTNFALLVSQSFTEPFNSSNDYGEHIAKLSNMLGNGVIVQRFGDLIRGQRTNEKRLAESTVSPTLNCTPGDLSLVLPKRILDDIIETIYALDKVCPGTANDDTLIYGVEVKFYNMEVEVDDTLRAKEHLFVIGDGSGITHGLSQAAASGLYVSDVIMS